MTNEFRKKVLEALYTEADTAVDVPPVAPYAFNVKMKGKRGTEPLSQDFDINVRGSSIEAAKAQAVATAQKQGYTTLDVVSVEIVSDTKWHEINKLGQEHGTGIGFDPKVFDGQVGLDAVSHAAAESPKTGSNTNEPGYRAAIQGHQ